ncbi:DNA polymerase III subunit gamma/tau [Niveispirillum lacus]|uniref:DNA polymerase III subunit gamma/tau n=1 Tax=Niveispirillum lacus TaxID=1981099 RepID=A0A255YYB2_9PROT|nr:DNA polymerase III subunit gamma/tau [Niveispirillum lacus]OYQ34178.1 DNA polymerase III subunit gamma/tau [Niveispirillum lacus]
MTDETNSHSAAGAAYRVLARKYRPQNFDELVGQDALVRTLRNAIQSGRIHQAYMLTGVRGVGKTTTARIIARALNCIGPDGQGGPTISPCGVCEMCVSIAADRNVDVIEMDAASNTGVDNVREIIEGVRYAPSAARYKLYIIDEVHMLSKSAFNALLKTLEEPPPHVKFVFATTEIRKVPVTVLSRCQRFDLRRVDHPTLVGHFTRVAGKEGVAVEADAIAQIARAADGSVRDGLSLLDQAMALGGGSVTLAQVRDMLGLADRTRVIDLFEATMTAKPADALDILTDLHRCGADPIVITQDLLDFTHFLTRARVIPGTADDVSIQEDERTRGVALAQKLGMAALSRAWQILLKGLGEIQHAPVPMQALEMVLIRLSYASDLPSPADLIRKINEAGGVEAAARALHSGNAGGGGGFAGGGGTGPMVHAAPTQGAPMAMVAGGRAIAGALAPAPLVAPQPVSKIEPVAEPTSFRAVADLFLDKREGVLAGMLRASVHMVRFEPGMIELRLLPACPQNLPGKVGQLLTEWTGKRWVVSVSGAAGEPTIAEQDRAAEQRQRAEAADHPLVKAVLEAFPGARIDKIIDQSHVTLAPPPMAETEIPEAMDIFGGDEMADSPYFDAPPPLDEGDYEGDF